MPAADELFRTNGPGGISNPPLSTMGSAARAPRADRLRAVPDPVDVEEEAEPAGEAGHAVADREEAAAPPQPQRGAASRRASGRERHEDKITVYVSPEELLGLEQARITLRAQHALAVDRGRIVREAIDLVLADFDEHGDESLLVRTLRSH